MLWDECPSKEASRSAAIRRPNRTEAPAVSPRPAATTSVPRAARHTRQSCRPASRSALDHVDDDPRSELSSRANQSGPGSTVVELVMIAVAEAPALHRDPPWPVAARRPGEWLTLDGKITGEEVGLFVAGLGPDLETILAEEMLLAVGGLLVADTDSGVVVQPGCCAGLEDWRDWQGGSPWLGHDPTPVAEFDGDDVRLWRDGKRGEPLVFSRDELGRLLAAVQGDLIGFLGAVERWGGSRLAAAVDWSFRITAPL
jgi:hypothetical protein